MLLPEEKQVKVTMELFFKLEQRKDQALTVGIPSASFKPDLST